MFQSIKILDGFSTCFRQWIAESTHCKFLHGYSIYFEVTYQGELDCRSWVHDHGGLKRATFLIDGKKPKDWLDYMFDHTTIIALDDPYLRWFEEADENKTLQLRVIPQVGCERFAELVCNKLHEWVQQETNGRVGVFSVRCYEHSKNSAVYINPNR